MEAVRGWRNMWTENILSSIVYVSNGGGKLEWSRVVIMNETYNMKNGEKTALEAAKNPVELLNRMPVCSYPALPVVFCKHWNDSAHCNK